MTSHRLLVQLGTLCLILGACAAEKPDAGDGSGGSGGGSDSPTAGVTGTSGKAGTGGTAGTSGKAGNGGSAGMSGTSGLAGSAGTSGKAGTGGSAGTSATAGTSGSGGTAGSGGADGQITTGGAAGSSGLSGIGGVGDTGGRGGADAGAAGKGDAAGAGAGGGGGLPLNNPPVPSAGCAKAPMLTTGSKMIMSSGAQRHYNITIPSNYEMNKAYRVVYASHGLGGNGDAITRENYYGLKSVTDAANDPAVFVAPTGLDGRWGEDDHPLFDDILALVKQNLCVDTSRVFVLGFSFGGMYTYSLSLNHQQVIRAAIGLGPANYNIWLPTNTREPIAWMQTTGMGDTTTPWVNGNSSTQGAKYIAIQHATDNGCMVPTDIPTWMSGGTLCYDFVGCAPGYPVKACTFNGGHTLPPAISDMLWAFISQF